MALVYVLYGLMIIQGILFALYFTGKGYVMSMMWEFACIILRVWLCVLESGLKWILPAQRKNIHGEIALVTGAASGIGRLIALRLAFKGLCSAVQSMSNTLHTEGLHLKIRLKLKFLPRLEDYFFRREVELAYIKKNCFYLSSGLI